MGAEISKTTENGKTTLVATGNDLKYWEIEKLPSVKEWTKANNFLIGSSEVMENDKKKKVWSITVNFDTVKAADNFLSQIKKVKEFYQTFEENMRSLVVAETPKKPEESKLKETAKKPKEPKESKELKETKKIDVLVI